MPNRYDQVQRIGPQSAQSAGTVSRKKPGSYVMPGLCAPLVHDFRAKAGVIPTPRTIADNRGVTTGVVTAALLNDLYDQVSELRAIVGLGRRAA